MLVSALNQVSDAIQGVLTGAPNDFAIPIATIVVPLIADTGLSLGGATLIDNNMFNITGEASRLQGLAESAFDLEATLDPSNANNMQILIELGLADMDIAGGGTVLATFVTESQIVGGANSDLVKFFLLSYFQFSIAPASYRLRVRALVSGAAITSCQPVTLRSKWERKG